MEDSITINEEKPIDEPKNTKTKKRKRNNIEDDDDEDDVVASVKKMNIKGIILSVTKPSYTLKRGIGRELRSLRSEHRNRLRYILRQLVRRQNWDEACGVLSLLLKGTYRESGGLLNNRIKYWATLELLQHMKVAKLKDKAVQVYDLWMKKDTDITKKKRYFKGRFDVHLEYLLFCLSRGDTQRAKDSVPSLQQDKDFSKDPIANLFAGLFFSHLWYNAIPKEALLHESLECNSPIQSGTSGPGGSMLIDNSNGQSAVEIQDSDAAFIPDLNTSIRIGKEGVNQERKVLMEVGYELKKEILGYEELHMNSDESDQNGNTSRFLHTGDKIYGSIVSAHGGF
ncbi:hypothetical protein M8C21_013423 [Ambrosia artemisiifolia]|uniref:Uncharacterized protein n=1 Tax=Ambrosia artemisiifolia TaxID=4212 RepID=A0AAD5CY04_AMBAR|nr:hypothetical protein M8C21_013423 [Ambrosia artemisiifolia]